MNEKTKISSIRLNIFTNETAFQHERREKKNDNAALSLNDSSPTHTGIMCILH